MSCQDTDTLIELSRALGRNPRDSLQHLTDCEECMDVLVASATVRSSLTQSHPTHAGFTEQVLDHVPFGERPRSSRLWGIFEPLLASVTVIAATAAAGTSAPMTFNANTLVVAGLAGIAATLLLRSSTMVELGKAFEA